PRMVKEGRAQYADPTSIIRAGAMLLDHVGFKGRADRLHMALDICGQYEKRLVITGRASGATSAEYADYIMETLELPDLKERWQSYTS
ncbi:MAG: isocitrate/isopropylmalate dehydrogenase family protein, partial [Bacillota bacterium]